MHTPSLRPRAGVRRLGASTVASLAVLAMTSAPAAAATEMNSYEGEATAQILRLRLNAPSELLGPLGMDGGLDIGLGDVTASLGSDVDSLVRGLLGPAPLPSHEASADGSYSESFLSETLGPLTLNVAEITSEIDEQAGLATVSTAVSDIVLDLSGLFSQLPADVGDQLNGALDEVDVVVEGLVGQLNGALDQVEDAVGQVTGQLPVDLPEVLPSEIAPLDLREVPLMVIDTASSLATVETVGGVITSTSTSTIGGVTLLGGTINVPTATFLSTATAGGAPGTASADTRVDAITLDIAGTEVSVDGGVISVGDVSLDLNDPELEGLPVDDVLDPVLDVLGQILDAGGLSILQGEGVTDVADDGSFASAATSALALRLRPLQAVGEELLDLNLELLTTGVAVAGSVADPEPAPAPAPAPEPEPAPLPRTGGGAAAMLLGMTALGGAFALRRRS